MRKAFIKWIKRIIGSIFFLGYIPLIPGTIGSLLTVGLLWYFKDDISCFFTPEYAVYFWLAYLAFLSICVFFSNNAKEIFGEHDAKQIIIDECAGQIITFFLLPLTWRVLLLGFVLFRFFDIVKPFPVYKFEDIEDGLGIAMDDVAAGIMANLSIFFILWIYNAIAAYL